MGKQIVTTLIWTVILFILLSVSKRFIGVADWLEETLNFVIPSAIGYFMGYGQARKDENS